MLVLKKLFFSFREGITDLPSIAFKLCIWVRDSDYDGGVEKLWDNCSNRYGDLRIWW